MKNVGQIDKILRFVLAFILAAVAYKFQPELGAWFWALLVGAIIFAGTALINFCPLYTLIGFQSNKGEEE